MNLSHQRFVRSVSLVLLIATVPVVGLPQITRRTPPKRRTQVLENNVRAQLAFLASDAMQGRASGSGFERIAAEYIASQFRQFGLDPAGDLDSTGAKGFVQKVSMETVKFTEAPVLTATVGTDVHKWQFGRDFSLSFLRAPHLSGPLQVIDVEGTPSKGAVVMVRLPENVDGQKRQGIVRRARAAQVSAVVLLESESNRRTREAGELKFPALGSRIEGEALNDSPFAVISARKELIAELATLPGGTLVELSGPTQKSESGTTWNAVGMLQGTDPKAAKEAIVLSAHLDHLGVSDAAGADTIFNGADDDASGCVAVLELARALAAAKRPRRTVYFVCFGSEERGGNGARYFVSHSPVPLDHVIADITFEMLGRPDAKVAANTLWLTGYDRSNLGPTLATHGARLVADPHPEQNFFQRSDNYTLALRGVVAHTVSSFGLHTDYHRPSDEISKIDFAFMTRSIDSMIVPIRWLANSNFRPLWLPGKAPKAT